MALQGIATVAVRNEEQTMSSCVIVSCSQGFVISTDTIAFKQPVGEQGPKYGRVKGSTHKLFQLTEDVIAAGVGDWSSYLPVLNAAARLKLPTEKLVEELLDMCVRKAANARVFVLSRVGGKARLDISELGHVRHDVVGAQAFPDPLLNGLFTRVYESPEGLAVRKSGMLGVAALVNGFNALAACLNPEMASLFDTVCFLHEGMFVISGGLARLPVTDFW
jgi:hypothetical protein